MTSFTSFNSDMMDKSQKEFRERMQGMMDEMCRSLAKSKEVIVCESLARILGGPIHIESLKGRLSCRSVEDDFNEYWNLDGKLFLVILPIEWKEGVPSIQYKRDVCRINPTVPFKML